MICEYDMDGWANVAGGSWPVQAGRATEFACWVFFLDPMMELVLEYQGTRAGLEFG